MKQHQPFTGGIPRRHTIDRILRSVVAESILEALLNSVNERRSHLGKPIIALDGKVLREAYRGDVKKALQLVTAYDFKNGLVLTQKRTADKQSEISTVKDMLDTLDVKGAVVTVDALHCQQDAHERKEELYLFNLSQNSQQS